MTHENQLVRLLGWYFPARRFERIDLQGSDIAMATLTKIMSVRGNASPCPRLLIAGRPSPLAGGGTAAVLRQLQTMGMCPGTSKYRAGRVVLLPDLAGVSSTMARTDLLVRDVEALRSMLQPQVLLWCLMRSSDSNKSAELERLLEAERQERRSLELEIAAQAQTPRERQLQVDECRGRMQCTVCLDAERCVALQPCFHLVACQQCVQRLQSCPVCRATVEGHLRVSLA